MNNKYLIQILAVFSFVVYMSCTWCRTPYYEVIQKPSCNKEAYDLAKKMMLHDIKATINQSIYKPIECKLKSVGEFVMCGNVYPQDLETPVGTASIARCTNFDPVAEYY